MSAEEVIKTIRLLLVNELKDTDALVFDVRSNGGGQISLADGIPQLFTPSFDPMGARALISKVNEKIFESSLFTNTEWASSYALSLEHTYMYPVRFTSKESANYYGMAYLKPVAVLTNANCYSACDLFAASMQDSGAAVIFGEDPTTVQYIRIVLIVRERVVQMWSNGANTLSVIFRMISRIYRMHRI